MENDWQITKPLKIVLYSLGAFGFLVVLSGIMWSIFGPTWEQVKQKRDLSENFNGKVDSLYFEIQNHDTKVAILSSKYHYEIMGLWEPYIQVGDSLSKSKGSYIVYIYKKNNKKIYLDYRYIYNVYNN